MDFAQHLPALQVIVPLLAAPLIVLLQPRGFAWAATTATAFFSFAVSIAIAVRILAGDILRYEMGGWFAPIGIELRVDAFSAIVLLIISGAAAISLIAARNSINQQIEDHRQPLFFAAWLLAIAGLVGMVVTADAFNIFVFMEISSLAGYILIAGGPDRRTLPAVFKYLIIGTIGATFYLIGVGMIYMMTGTLNLEDMAQRVVGIEDQRPILVAAAFVFIGLALKAALFPLHVWLPNAYTHAPHMVTVFLAACGTKVAVYVLLRFQFSIFQSFGEHLLQFALFLMPLALLGIIVASLVAMFEGHLKRMLAFSSVAQIGYILMGASLMSDSGITASTLHMFNHALTKGALFLAVAKFATQYADLRIDSLKSAARSMPLTSFAFVIAGLSLIGVPGTAGFISKWQLIMAIMETGNMGFIMVAIVVISSLIAVGYIWRVIETLYAIPTDDLPDDAADVSVKPEKIDMLLIALIFTVAMNIYFGLVPGLPLTLAELSSKILLKVEF
ncbi:MAG: monovalent cation/H+ antiporter subunit D family protein [Pseudomonadales bacterium]|nr:monovalent cation/H+ antiporter subunit D family protein [Pseudomonadales bacterium]MDG1443022.1 monovalent cation/H+ antiporter subunit D family protein [Pseudomonadales bacterium]